MAAHTPIASEGYGTRIPQALMVRTGRDAPWSRVYAVCVANAASLYVEVGGEVLYLRDADVEAALDYARRQNGGA